VQAAWVGGLYAQAGEILAYTNSGWAAASITNLKNMLNGIIVPLIQGGAQGKNGNWEDQCANSMIQIGVFTSSTTVYNTGISLWNGRGPTYVYDTGDGAHPKMPTGGYSSASSGYCSPATASCDPYGYWGQAGGGSLTLVEGTVQELCRDFEHATEGVNALMEGAETARIQGNPSLFTGSATRFSAAMELLSKYLNKAGAHQTNTTYTTTDTWLCGGTLTMLGGSTSSPIPGWEIGYNEFVNREGLSMPNTLALLTANRPMTYDGTHQSAWETLTHAGVGTGSCTPITCSAMGYNCGSVSDGCGATLNCGSCTSPATCGGGGTKNVCGTSCTPTTCSALGYTCGTAGDGCGGTLNCGSCTAPQYCGGGGTANHCANDSVAPSVPTNLSGTATTAQVVLTWNVSTDNVGVTGYNVYRGGTQIGTTATHGYTDSTVSANSSYSYTVSGYDAAGNTSAQSTAFGISTPGTDTTPPSVPTGLAKSSSSSSSISLTWTASTDNVAVKGYDVYRNGTKVGTSTSASYTDTGLAASTSYSYTVDAYDAAGNTSAKSSSYSASTNSSSCSISVTQNTYDTTYDGWITYKNTGTGTETNPVMTFTLPSGATIDNSQCVKSNMTFSGASISAVSCHQSGTTETVTMTGTVNANGTVQYYYTTQLSHEAVASSIVVTATSCP
jgi:chitodextrinase